jgi:MoaA/NifB/PqqE/SkfB family radical SAM enzyme
MIEAGANEFGPAVHGHIKELHDYLTGSPGSFEQVVQGIRNLKALNQNVITNTVITKSNYRHLPQIAELLVSLNVDQYQFAFVHALGSAKRNFGRVVPRMKLVEPYVKKGLDVGIKAGKIVMTEAITYCFMKGYESYIAEKIIPECKIYDYKKIVDDFTFSRKNEGKIKGPQCLKCKYNQICEGPWREYPEKFGWDEFKPIK